MDAWFAAGLEAGHARRRTASQVPTPDLGRLVRAEHLRHACKRLRPVPLAAQAIRMQSPSRSMDDHGRSRRVCVLMASIRRPGRLPVPGDAAAAGWRRFRSTGSDHRLSAQHQRVVTLSSRPSTMCSGPRPLDRSWLRREVMDVEVDQLVFVRRPRLRRPRERPPRGRPPRNTCASTPTVPGTGLVAAVLDPAGKAGLEQLVVKRRRPLRTACHARARRAHKASQRRKKAR